MRGIGIILNELLTNSLKHTDNRVEIKFVEHNGYCNLIYFEKGNTVISVNKIINNRKLVFLMAKEMNVHISIKKNDDLCFKI